MNNFRKSFVSFFLLFLLCMKATDTYSVLQEVDQKKEEPVFVENNLTREKDLVKQERLEEKEKYSPEQAFFSFLENPIMQDSLFWRGLGTGVLAGTIAGLIAKAIMKKKCPWISKQKTNALFLLTGLGLGLVTYMICAPRASTMFGSAVGFLVPEIFSKRGLQQEKQKMKGGCSDNTDSKNPQKNFIEKVDPGLSDYQMKIEGLNKKLSAAKEELEKANEAVAFLRRQGKTFYQYQKKRL